MVTDSELKASFPLSTPFSDAWSAAQGIAVLVTEIRRAPIEPGMPMPAILVVSPPLVQNPRSPIADKFRGAEHRCASLAKAYSQVASDLGCDFFDVESVTASSTIDGVHLDADQHLKLGTAMAEKVNSILK
jgi:lysophospholipase L1-like esterase